MSERSSAASADEIGDFGTYNNFRDHIGEKFCAVVNGVNGVISCACGDLRIEREHNGSVTLSKRAAKLLTGALQQPGIPAQTQPAWGGWTPDQFWEYVEGLTDTYTRDCMRDMLADRGLSFASAQQQLTSEHGRHIPQTSPAPGCDSGSLSAQKAPDCDDILSVLYTYRDHQPEEDESWESWYYAAFDLACMRIRKLFKRPAVTGPAVSSTPSVSAQLQPQWQPIETAPKGDSILAYFGPENEGWFKCCLNDDRYAARGPKPYWEPAEARYLGITWARKNQPKVWMPLPATPALPSPERATPEGK